MNRQQDLASMRAIVYSAVASQRQPDWTHPSHDLLDALVIRMLKQMVPFGGMTPEQAQTFAKDCGCRLGVQLRARDIGSVWKEAA